MSEFKPIQFPPTTTAVVNTAQPRSLSEAELTTTTRVNGKVESTPSELSVISEVNMSENKKVTALWSINENRNTWVHVENMGWRKLVNSSDSAIVALNLVASHAKQMQSPVTYREEADGMIYEMYVW